MADIDFPVDLSDERAVSEALIERYYAYLHRLAFSILGDDQEADDAAQETLLRALAGLKKSMNARNMKGWLATITINLCRDMLRRRASRQRLAHTLQWIGFGQSEKRTPENALLQSDSNAALWQAVEDLDEKHRIVVVLRFVQGMAVGEIARALNIREGTVHSRLYYALRKLQVRLADSDILESEGLG